MPKYDAAFWRRVVARSKPGPLLGRLSRIVENQQQKVTLSLVDSLEEHDVLEQLLEASKPGGDIFAGLARFDYLLRTPWRYPPLPWGSRFGRQFEPSLFYGALSTRALFAEAAYYRLVFLEGMTAPFADRVISQFTVFDARYRGEHGLNLSAPPFEKHEQALRHPADYSASQALGTVLRDADIDSFTYLSAREPGEQLNVALFRPTALQSRKHLNPRHGIAETRYEGVTFRFGDTLHRCERAQFLVNGELPVPA